MQQNLSILVALLLHHFRLKLLVFFLELLFQAVLHFVCSDENFESLFNGLNRLDLLQQGLFINSKLSQSNFDRLQLLFRLIGSDDDPGELLVDFLNVVEYLLGFHLLLGLRLPNIFYFSPEFIDSVFQILLLERALLNIVFELETVRELVIAEEPEIDEDAQKFPDPERIQRKLGKYGKH